MFAVALTGCSSAEPTIDGTSAGPGDPTAVIDGALTSEADLGTAPAPVETPDATPSPELTPQAPFIIPSENNAQPPVGPDALLDAFFAATGSGDTRAIQRMGDSGDPSYIPVLVDYLRFSQFLSQESRFAALFAMATLIGEEPAELSDRQLAWDWWANWVGEHPEVNGPHGYTGFKADLFSRVVDPNMAVFLYDGVISRIRLEEIVWGGVQKDGIPDLTNPPVMKAGEAEYLFDDDRVFGVSFNGEHRAYPLRILNAHEMANDVVGGVPFALAY